MRVQEIPERVNNAGSLPESLRGLPGSQPGRRNAGGRAALASSSAACRTVSPLSETSSFAAGNGLTAFASNTNSCTCRVISPVRVRNITPDAWTKSPMSNILLKKSIPSWPSSFIRKNNWIRPSPSSIWAKVILPMARMARMRPARVTFTSADVPPSPAAFSASSNAAIACALVWVRLARVGYGSTPSFFSSSILSRRIFSRELYSVMLEPFSRSRTAFLHKELDYSIKNRWFMS